MCAYNSMRLLRDVYIVIVIVIVSVLARLILHVLDEFDSSYECNSIFVSFFIKLKPYRNAQWF